MKINEREFNIFEGKRPKVLLLGNGINRAYGGTSWDGLLDSIKDNESYPLSAYQYCMPMPFKAAMLTNNSLASKMREIVKDASDAKIAESKATINWSSFINTNPQMCNQIKRIVQGFDYVLTTNYSYEIEIALSGAESFTPRQIARLMHCHEVSAPQTKFLINTFNLVNKTPVWHIHGEARKPDSMIIGSAYYGKLLRRCVERIDGAVTTDSNKKETKSNRIPHGKAIEFKRNFKKLIPQKIGSWVDAFVLGDVYIIGLGMDFSESELWWLMDLKSSDKELYGKTVFLDPEIIDRNVCAVDYRQPCGHSSSFSKERQCRNLMLKNTYSVDVDNLGITITNNEDYLRFYESAAEHFNHELSK